MRQRKNDLTVFEALAYADVIGEVYKREVYKRLSEEDQKIFESLERIRQAEFQIMVESEEDE